MYVGVEVPGVEASGEATRSAQRVLGGDNLVEVVASEPGKEGLFALWRLLFPRERCWCFRIADADERAGRFRETRVNPVSSCMKLL